MITFILQFGIFNFVAMQKSKENLPPLTFKDSIEAMLVNVIHVDGPYQINCDGQIGGSFVWNDCGLELTFPPKCSQKNIQVTMSASLPITQEVHPGVYIVSAVYKFDCNIKHFDIPFILRLQHCVKLQSSVDCHKMRFISQHGDKTDIIHGDFEVDNCYGALNLNRFCAKCITYSKEENYREAQVHEVVSQHQNDCNSESFSVNIASGHSNGSSEITSDVSSASQHNNSSTSSVDVTSCNTEKEQEQIESPPLRYEWMLALPKNHFKLTTWNGIYSVYIKLPAWRKVNK